jgi:ParB family transcriptional regulator, chromosome partitioning protein
MSKTTKTIKSKKPRSKLGRGLSSLVDQASAVAVEVSSQKSNHRPETQGVQELEQNTNTVGLNDQQQGDPTSGKILELDVTHIVPNPFQPRRVFDEESLEELANSIRMHGLMQPISVRENGEGSYELVAGERRWRATCRTGASTISALLVEANDEVSAQLALIENIQREDLNPIERARGLAALVSTFDMTQQLIGERVGISRSSVSNLLRLLDLDDEIQSMIASGLLSAGHGKGLLSCSSEDNRLETARRAVEEGWSVRELERRVSTRVDVNIKEHEPEVQEKVGLDGVSRLESVLEDLEKTLSDHMSTRVKLKTDRSGTKGSITIEFYNLDHFDGLLNRLGVSSEQDLNTI